MAAILDLTIEQGATFEIDISVTDENGDAIDLTDYIARMSIKRDTRESTALLEFTQDNGRLILGGTAGTVTIYLTAAETAALIWRRGVYDLELVSGEGVVTRLCEGGVTVSTEVTA